MGFKLIYTLGDLFSVGYRVSGIAWLRYMGRDGMAGEGVVDSIRGING